MNTPPAPNPVDSPRTSATRTLTLRCFSSIRALPVRLASPATEYKTGAYLFLRLLGLCHLIAFLSVWHQLDGLLGDNGVLPASQWLAAVAQQIGTARFLQAPTLCWLSPNVRFLEVLCAAGTLTALALSIGLATPGNWLPCLPRNAGPPNRAALLVLWWLIFRLMFMSGAVKLLSHDPLWSQWTALGVHFETQPLPTPLAWWVHKLPASLHKASCGAMFAIELGGPFLIACGRWGRRLAALLFCALMLLIALTGNYCFFNLLVAALCLTLVDDHLWRALSDSVFPRADPTGAPPGNLWWKLAYAPFLLLCLWCSGIQTGAQLFKWRAIPGWATLPLRWAGPFRTINSYGLFAVMTKSRPEIVLEGSADGKVWKEYHFKWKAGAPQQRPPIVAPYQPRLDWQMWFASLGDLRGNPWLSNLMLRILQGSPSVLALLGENPFPDQPPQYLRAALFKYKFTDPA
ncbi:MAG: lipase maturation factor family protein, partial [Verrucomicrobia bacterium]|nr:lipase maturation factor family protein [Verrucomicrobiota bacterium]